MPVRTCQGCGASLPEDARFCLKCGKELVAPPPPPPQPPPEPGFPVPPRKRRSYKDLPLAVRLLLSVAALVGLFLLVRQSSNDLDALLGVLALLSIVALVMGTIAMLVGAVRKKGSRTGAIVFGSGLGLFIGVLVIVLNTAAWDEITATTPTPTPSPTPVETLEQILTRGTAVTSAKFVLVTTVPGQPPVTEKLWVKGNRIRAESSAQGQDIIILQFVDTRMLYVYEPAKNEAMKGEVAEGEDGLLTYTPAKAAGQILKENPVQVGTQTIDGKDCIKVEATFEDGGKYFAWVWKERGIPIKAEVSTGNGIMSLEWKNIEFFYIPEATFELPADAKVTLAPSPTPTPAPSPTPEPSPTPSPTPTPTPTPTLTPSPSRYKNITFGYSVEQPGGWTVDSHDSRKVYFTSPDNGAIVLVSAWSESGNSLDPFTNWLISTLRASHPDYQELSRTKITLAGGVPAYAIEYLYTDTNNNKTEPYRFLAVVAVKGERQIELTAVTYDSNWEYYKAELTRVAYGLTME